MTDVIARLRAFGMTYPGAHPKSPWEGHDDLAVNDKTFAYLGVGEHAATCGFKLPFTAPKCWRRPTPSPCPTASASPAG